MLALSEADIPTSSAPVGCGENEITIGFGLVIEIVAVPVFVGSSVEVALTVSEPEVGTVAGAVYSPELEIVPETADQATPEL
jgi:hypothetical protein